MFTTLTRTMDEKAPVIIDQGADATRVNSDALANVLEEIRNQPPWRGKADKEMDYKDGNQLDADILQRQQAIGIPPAIEPLIGPTIDDILGMEAKNRTDWQVLPDGDETAEEVAEALNHKLNKAEKKSGADHACSEAYESQVSVGIGWVEVAKEQDPFKFPHRCEAVHRNEIWWDWTSKRKDLSDARWLLRRKWTDVDIAALMFSDKEELIRRVGNNWSGTDITELISEGGTSTGLAMEYAAERGWSVEEQEWRDIQNRRVCLFELWYRQFSRAEIMTTPEGRSIEFNRNDPWHVRAAQQGKGYKVVEAVIGKVRLAWFLGPHLLMDMPSPYRHNRFPYIPFWGKKEDRTGVPYGLIRGMMYLQDEINARISKMQWGLAAVRTIRTKGAVKMDDATFRNEVARPDADIQLDAQHMQQGGIFKIERDFQLSEQQARRLEDAREAIKRVGRVTDAFSGNDPKGQSGVALSQLVEQSVQSLADMNDNFQYGRALVGDTLLSNILEDMKGTEESIFIEGDTIQQPKTIKLNVPTVDPVTGVEYLNNDTERVKLKVELADVPTTPSFRSQQLASISEVFKSMPANFQSVTLPYVLDLMTIPHKKEIIEAIRAMSQQATPEQIEQQIKEAVEKALALKGFEIKNRELDIKERETDARIKKLVQETVSQAIDAIYSATQAGKEIAVAPGVAPIADQVLRSAGFEDQDMAPIVAAPGPVAVGPDVRQNTSPAFPPRIGEMAPDVTAEIPPPASEGEAGPMAGIEAQGVEGGEG